MAIDRNSLTNDPEMSLRLALDGRQAMMWTALPCIVDSVDYGAMTIEAVPSIQGEIEQEDGSFQVVNLPKLVDVPIIYPGAGNFIFTFPLSPGDEVLVVFSSRCIDAWWQNGGIGRPIEARMHDLSDGFAIPGPRSQPNVIPNINSTVPELRNKTGTLAFRFSSTGFEIDGDLDVDGSISATGDITADGDVVAGTISLKNHTHSVVVPSTPFTGDTGGPS